MKRRRALGAQTRFIVEDIPVVLTRKSVKNINFRVVPIDGHLEVSAPVWVDEKTIHTHIKRKIPWIKRRQISSQEALQGRKKSSSEELAKNKKIIALRSDPLFTYWERRLGVRAQKRVYREMSSRWGSCNTQTGRICLNTRLIDYPEECLEYVVVHELCHLIESNHGPQFKALLDYHLPDWRQKRARLKAAP